MLVEHDFPGVTMGRPCQVTLPSIVDPIYPNHGSLPGVSSYNLSLSSVLN